MNTVYPCLWFDGKAHEATQYYCSIFKNSKIVAENPMVVRFELNGSSFMALNGGPHFTFNEAISVVVECENQHEIDHYWHELTKNGGQEGVCGWLKDKYGLSWQIVPKVLSQLMTDAQRAPRVMQALQNMTKLNIAALQAA